MSILDLFEKGGPVVWVLAGYSVIALGIALDRFVLLFLAQKPPSDINEALSSEYLDYSNSPEAYVARSMLEAVDEGVTDLDRVASRAGTQEVVRMERGLRTMAFMGNTAPLLGLLGTIVGMIKAFMVIELAGGKVDAQALAGGIWEAMITTGVGLAVSLPTLFLLHFLEGIVDRRAHSIKRLASIIIERRQKHNARILEDASRHIEEVV
ncbi:hypothetical protein MNBD_NITROSPINAE01-1245 [hydrothermal vent metagenome]|uniref:MotA/TolQ/ExbB proton channel domain-containing protein n=1 Tax=hydrothermal vent metagenome TaxID=652676 RepID=A0A3B1C0I0_9ZZZZ